MNIPLVEMLENVISTSAHFAFTAMAWLAEFEGPQKSVVIFSNFCK